MDSLAPSLYDLELHLCVIACGLSCPAAVCMPIKSKLEHVGHGALPQSLAWSRLLRGVDYTPLPHSAALPQSLAWFRLYYFDARCCPTC